MGHHNDADATSAAGSDAASGKKPGRPALGGHGKTSPQIAFRVIPAVRKRAKEVADHEGLTVSQLSRKALKQYLDQTAKTASAK